MKIVLVEFLGGPHDGARLPVVAGTETIVIRDGHQLHRYDISEVYEGPKVRPVYRQTQTIPSPTRDR